VRSVRFFYNAESPFRDAERGEFIAADPPDIGAIVRGGEGAAGDAADVVHQNIVVFRPALGIAHDSFKNLEQTYRFDDESRLLENLTADPIGQCFAGFEHAAGERPKAPERLAATLREQDTRLVIEDERADSEHRPLGIPTAADG
jgi:hypothetical protein